MKEISTYRNWWIKQNTKEKWIIEAQYSLLKKCSVLFCGHFHTIEKRLIEKGEKDSLSLFSFSHMLKNVYRVRGHHCFIIWAVIFHSWFCSCHVKQTKTIIYCVFSNIMVMCYQGFHCIKWILSHLWVAFYVWRV